MNFSKTTRYALKTLALMATDPKKLFSAHALHKELGIPKKYLQRLLTELSKNGIVESKRGKYGGFQFTRSIKKIFLSEIIDAVEGFRRVPICFFGFHECILKEPCAMHHTWAKSQHDTIEILTKTSLSDLVRFK
jgi:Rrf2 family iron-sulfur cluster assembly transcriptional regulator